MHAVHSITLTLILTSRLTAQNVAEEPQPLSHRFGFGEVTAVAALPETNRFLSAGSTGLLLWDAETGRVIRDYPGFPGNLRTIRVAPGGRLVWLRTEQEDAVGDLQSGKLLYSLPGGRAAAVFTPDGNHLVVLGDPAAAKARWRGPRPDDPTLLRFLAARSGHVEQVVTSEVWQADTVAFSADGSRFAVAGQDDKVEVWNRAEGKRTRVFDLNRTAVTGLALAAQDRQLMIGGAGTIGFWDLETGALLRRVETQNEIEGRPTLSPDESLVVMVGELGFFFVADASSGAKRGMLISSRVGIDIAGDAAARGRWAILAADDRILLAAPLSLWDLRDGKLVRLYEGCGVPMALSPKGTYALTGYAGDTALWETDTGRLMGPVGFSPPQVHHRQTNGVWDSAIFDQVHGVTRHRFSPDERWVSGVAPEGRIVFCRVDQRSPIHSLAVGGEDVRDFTFSRDGEGLLVVGGDRVIRAWQVPEGELKWERSIAASAGGDRLGTVKLEEAPDGRRLAVVQLRPEGAAVNLLDLESGDTISTFQVVGMGSTSATVAFTPDSEQLLLATGMRVTLSRWDWRSGKLLHAVQTRSGGGPAGTFTADGQAFWTPQRGGLGRIDLETGATTRFIKRSGSVIRAEIASNERFALVHGQPSGGAGFDEIWDLSSSNSNGQPSFKKP